MPWEDDFETRKCEALYETSLDAAGRGHAGAGGDKILALQSSCTPATNPYCTCNVRYRKPFFPDVPSRLTA
jgi:hypothetical protein